MYSRIMAIFLICITNAWADGLLISEFMAVNSYIPATNPQDIHTTVNGAEVHPDWIEIHNPDSSNSISLVGWYLTDDSKNLTKWPLQLPMTDI